MKPDALTALLQEKAVVHEQRDGFWNVDYLDRNVLLVNQPAGLLRIMTPILPAEEIEIEVLFQVLQANFERTRNARYALNGDYLWAVFAYSMEELTADEVLVGMDQVTLLADTFGATFSASLMTFGE